jgi:hypothetical protein
MRSTSRTAGPIARVGMLQPAIVSFFITVQTWSALSQTNELCTSHTSHSCSVRHLVSALPDQRTMCVTYVTLLLCTSLGPTLALCVTLLLCTLRSWSVRCGLALYLTPRDTP